MKNIDVSVNLGRMKLRNPTILASGILGSSLDVLCRAFDSGAGAVVSKSVSLQPREGYPGPNIVEVEGGYVNAIGLSNPGVHEFASEFHRCSELEVPIIVSVFGGSAQEISRVITVLDRLGVAGFELNLSCPHVGGVGLDIGCDATLTAEIVAAARASTSKLLIAKLSAGVADIVSVGKSAWDNGADALTAINTIRAMAIDTEASRPILSNRFGGLSGPAIKPVGLRCVYELSTQLDIPIIGCGGITTWRDAAEYLLAGARAIQIGTAVATRGFAVFDEIVKGLREYTVQRGFSKLEDIIGAAHESN